MKYILFFIFSPFLFLGQNSVSLLDSMVLSINRIHSLKYDLKSMELINGKMISNHSMVKLNIKPFRVYSYLFLPEKGIEVLYTEKDNKALVLSLIHI